MRTRAIVVVLGLILAVGCGKEMTSPGGPSVVTAQVTSVEPAVITPGPDLVSIVVHGSNFLGTMQLVIAKSDGTSQTFSGSDLQNRSTTAFGVRALFTTPGVYSFLVANTPGDSVTPFVLTVSGNSSVGSPTITSLTPVSTVRSINPQILSLAGTNFDPTMTIMVFDPLGFPTIYSQPQLAVSSDTSATLSIVLNQLGTYTFRVILSDGRSSNQMSIPVN
jgi:hypothetical protein